MNVADLVGAVRILVVAPPQQFRRQIVELLEGDGFRVRAARNWCTAMALASKWKPILVLIDAGVVPPMTGAASDGSELDSTPMRWNPTTPSPDEGREPHAASNSVILVSEPMSRRELRVRIELALRRADANGKEIIQYSKICMDDASHRVSVNGSPVKLGPAEYRLLHFLLTHPNVLFTRSQLLTRTGYGGRDTNERVVDVRIMRLRKALEPHGQSALVQTVQGAGYRLSDRIE